jgi:rod shape-determining protein MreC
MSQRRVWGLFVALILTALVLVTVDFREGEGPADAGRDVAAIGLAPFERGLARVLAPVRRLGDGVVDLFATRSENQRLRAEVAELRERRRAFADLERELAETRALLGYRDDAELETAPARVIAVSPSNFEWTLTIDVGERDGVERGMAVVAAEGLVGRVLTTTATAARVLLAVDPNFSVAARSVGTSALGLVDGRGSDAMRFGPLDPRRTVEDGDEIVTATFPGSAIPAGIPIGRIVGQDARSSRLSSVYELLPFVDVTRLDHVLVVLSGPAVEVPPFEDSDDLGIELPLTRVQPETQPALPSGSQPAEGGG